MCFHKIEGIIMHQTKNTCFEFIIYVIHTYMSKCCIVISLVSYQMSAYAKECIQEINEKKIHTCSTRICKVLESSRLTLSLLMITDAKIAKFPNEIIIIIILNMGLVCMYKFIAIRKKGASRIPFLMQNLFERCIRKQEKIKTKRKIPEHLTIHSFQRSKARSCWR